MFADLFTDVGRRSVPPMIVAVVMVLQRIEGLSDREAVERFAFDARWKYAAGGLDFDYPGFVHTVLVDMRARLARSDRPDRIFETTLAAARAAGLVGRKRVLDSTALYDAVATMDTVTLIRSAIRALLNVADPGLEAKLRALVRCDDDYASAVSGPLAGLCSRFREELSALGYSARSAAGHLQLMAHLSRWLVEIGLAPGELTLLQAEGFVQGRRDCSRVHRSLTLRGMQPLLDHLRRVGVVPAVEPVAASGGREVVIERFTAYLIGERGLTASTIVNYRGVAGRLLAGCRWESGALMGVSSEWVNSFMLGEASRRSSGSLNTVATGLRALLRFMYTALHIRPAGGRGPGRSGLA